MKITKYARAIKTSVGNMRISKKMALTYTLLVVVMAIFSISALTQASRDSVTRNSRASIQSMVDKSSTALNIKMEQLENVLSMCAFRNELQAVYSNNYNSYYELYKGIYKVMIPYFQLMEGYCYGDVSELKVYSLKGLRRNDPYLYPAALIENEPWYAEALERNGLYWQFDANQIRAMWRIDSILSMRRESALGILYCSLKYEDFFKNYIDINWPAYEMRIYDKQGGELLRRAYGRMSEYANGPLIEYAFKWNKQGLKFTYLVPEETLTHYEDSGLFLLSVILILSGIAVSLMIMLLLTRSFLRDISMIHQKIAVIRGGSLDVTITSARNDEIGVMANQFGLMVANLRDMMQKIREAEQAQAELKLRVLRAQLDPHFLYNTLSYINWAALKTGNNDVAAMIRHLSAFYRTSLNAGRETIFVKNELENVISYTRIQQILHRDSFDVEYSFDDALIEHQMLSFVLQPLVENAIRHGIDQKKDGRGKIVIRAFLQNERICFVISDNGPGFKDERAAEITAQPMSNGYGITIVKQRISLFYSEVCDLTYPPAEQGCTALLTLPLLSITV